MGNVATTRWTIDHRDASRDALFRALGSALATLANAPAQPPECAARTERGGGDRMQFATALSAASLAPPELPEPPAALAPRVAALTRVAEQTVDCYAGALPGRPGGVGLRRGEPGGVDAAAAPRPAALARVWRGARLRGRRGRRGVVLGARALGAARERGVLRAAEADAGAAGGPGG